MVADLWQDVRYARRWLVAQLGFTIVVVLTLAVGIGLNTAMFSVAYGVLWRPLPYPNPDRLIIVLSAQQTGTGVKTFSTWPPLTARGCARASPRSIISRPTPRSTRN